MNAVRTYTRSGTKASVPTKLDKTVFGVKPNAVQLKEVYVAYLANGRENLAKTKTRGLVRGGGKKPWRQKGTGRARFGSSRNPIWRGGGVAFGPTGNENYKKSVTKSTRRSVLKQALSSALNEDKIIILETFERKEPKTSKTVKLLEKLDVQGSALLVVSQKDELVERATANIPNLIVKQAAYLNVFDLLNADTVIISKKSLDIITGWLSAKPGRVPAEKTEAAK